MRIIGIGYDSKDIEELIQTENAELGELIGLNFRLGTWPQIVVLSKNFGRRGVVSSTISHCHLTSWQFTATQTSSLVNAPS